MAFSIALAGKGGTGKTTMAGFLVKYLLGHHKTPVLAVDADSNSNLNEVLGVAVTDTVGNAREDMKKGVVPSGMTKDVFMSMKLEQAVSESDGFDLIVMGRPEGSGCYCAANSLLVGFLALTSLCFTDILGWFRLPRLLVELVALLALVAGFVCLRPVADVSRFNAFIRQYGDRLPLAIACLLIFLQTLFLYQRKTDRAYWYLLLFSISLTICSPASPAPTMRVLIRPRFSLPVLLAYSLTSPTVAVFSFSSSA